MRRDQKIGLAPAVQKQCMFGQICQRYSEPGQIWKNLDIAHRIGKHPFKKEKKKDGTY